MSKVTILDANVVSKPYSFKNDQGETVEGSTRSQKAKLEIGGFAYPYQVRIEGDGAGYPLGVYDLDLAAMAEVKNGKLGVSKYAVLKPSAK